MVGGGNFTILGLYVSMVATFAIALGGVVAWFAANSYVKLGLYYKDGKRLANPPTTLGSRA